MKKSTAAVKIVTAVLVSIMCAESAAAESFTAVYENTVESGVAQIGDSDDSQASQDSQGSVSTSSGGDSAESSPDDVKTAIDEKNGFVITLASKSVEYTGTKQTPAVSVTHGGRALTAGKDYMTIYSANVNVGTAKVVIAGKGGYRGRVEKYFDILPRAQRITAAALSGSGFKAAVTADESGGGYELSYSLRPDFSSARTVRTYSTAVTTLRAKALVGGRKYYMRARTFANRSGRMYFGKWSKTVSISSAPMYKLSSGGGSFIKARDLRTGQLLKLKTGYYSDVSLKNGKYIIKANYDRYEAAPENVFLMSGSGKILPTACISQLGKNNWYGYGCGPTSVAMILNSEAGLSVKKQSVIGRAERKGWCNDVHYGFANDGCNSKHIAKLLRSFGKRSTSVDSVRGRSAKAIVTLLKRQIKAGHRCIVTVRLVNSGDGTDKPVNRYDTKSDISHYVVVTGYLKEKGTDYFYVADPWYEDSTRYVNYNYGLKKVKAETLAKSVKSIPNSWKDYKNIVHFR